MRYHVKFEGGNIFKKQCTMYYNVFNSIICDLFFYDPLKCMLSLSNNVCIWTSFSTISPLINVSMFYSLFDTRRNCESGFTVNNHIVHSSYVTIYVLYVRNGRGVPTAPLKYFLAPKKIEHQKWKQWKCKIQVSFLK